MNTIKPDPPFSTIQAEKTTLENGLTVVTVEMPHLHTVELSLMVRAGLRMETKANNGISHFLEHMLFRGNAKFPDSLSLNREFETIGRDLRAETHSEYTSYGFSPHRPFLERAMELFGNFFDEPTFPGMELEREIILEECLEDLNDKGENININNLACQLMYDDFPLAWPTIGTEETIKAIDTGMLKSYFKKFYHPANSILVSAGALTHESFLGLARKYFGGWTRRSQVVSSDFFKLKETQGKPAILLKEDQDSQVQLQFCFRSRSYNHPDYFALCLISRIFDDGICSRLQRSLREDRGLVYSVECRATSWSDTGTFDFDVQVSPEKAQQVLNILYQEIKLFASEGPTEVELAHVKNRYDFDLELDLDDPYKQIDRYGFPLLYSSVMSVEEERECVRAVTVADCRQVASGILVRETLNIVAVGPISKELKQEVKKITDAF